MGNSEMIDEEQLKKKIAEKVEELKEKDRIEQLRKRSFRLNICPDCGEENVRVRYTPFLFFPSKETFTCTSCKSSLVTYREF